MSRIELTNEEKRKYHPWSRIKEINENHHKTAQMMKLTANYFKADIIIMFKNIKKNNYNK